MTKCRFMTNFFNCRIYNVGYAEGPCKHVVSDKIVSTAKITKFLTTHLGEVIGSHHNKNSSIGLDVLIEH